MLVLLIASVLDGIVANRMFPTMDEDDHIGYGVKILQGQPDRSNPYLDSKTPITALNALPRVIAEHMESFPGIRKFLWFLVRLSSVVAALVVIVFIYRFAYERYGPAAGWIAAILAALSPNLIAHGTLATSDGYFAAGVLATCYFLRRYLLEPTIRNGLISALTLALAQLTKPMAIYLYLIAGVFVILAMFRRSALRIRAKDLVVYGVLVIGLTVAVLNIAYSFDRTLTPWGSYPFESSVLKPLQHAPWIEKIPVPLPYPVLQGFDMMLHTDETGSTWGNIYLLGELRRFGDPGFHNFKSYYLVAWFFKEPIPLQILFIWGVVYVATQRKNDFLFTECLILAAAGVLVLWLSLFSRTQVGIRHILPALAIEIIIAAAPFSEFSAASRAKQGVLAGLVLWLGLSTFSYYPNMIPYMNEWVTDRRLSYRILADSNLDWGQDRGAVVQFLQNNPDVVLDPDQPVSGRVLISADRLVGITPKDTGPMTWALRYRPVAQVGYAHFLFNIPSDSAVDPK